MKQCKLRYSKIPLEYCIYALKSKTVNQSKTFLWLKISISGKVKIDKQIRNTIASDLNISPRTVSNHINKLLIANFLNFSKKSKLTFIKSWNWIAHKFSFQSKKAVRIYKDDLRKLRPAFAGAVFGYLAKRSRYRPVFVKGKTSKDDKLKYNSVALLGASKLTGLKISTLSRIKLEAKKEGYILVKKHYLKQKKIKISQLKLYKKYYPEKAERIIVKNGKVVEVRPDLIAPRMEYCRRKKMKILG